MTLYPLITPIIGPHWIAAISSAAADGSWYYVNTIYNMYPPVMSYTFQVTYAGQTPPTGSCYSSLPGVPQTSTTSAPSSTKSSAPITSTAAINASFNYSDALTKSILFYAAQRSGKLPTNNPISWRGDSAIYDAGNNGEDLTGGWYDAGDHVKFNLPISSATTLLAIGFIQWKQAYTAAGQLGNMYDSLKWPLDYFLKCWRPDPNNPIYYAQVADGDIDHAWWGRPEDMTSSNMPRPAYKVTKNQPGSDVAGETSAALAAGSIAFRDKDLQYSNTLLNAAKTLYLFADTYRGKYSDAIQDAAQFYSSSGYNDELTLAAVMLYKATGDQSYLTDAENKYNQFGLNYAAWAQSWDEKLPVVQLLLYQATGKQMYAESIENYLRTWRNDVTKTPGGLAWISQWGSLRYAANTAFVAMMAADLGLNPSINRQFAKSQIDYMLGKNSRSFSYLVGFGNNFPRKAHHKASSCPVDKNQPCGWNEFNSPNDNPNVLVGALVGGPDAYDNYADVRADYIKNEVTCDYNAGFQGVLAGIIDYMMGQSG
ncbi:hypothetical protein ACJMK2_007098 [Sinanodonta woodiana]|uniref:Endoglucanase n=1 Tax=Sinanodonta woodiana TaxID=1069815 RepID=A0ABD3VHF3_SINWO